MTDESTPSTYRLVLGPFAKDVHGETYGEVTGWITDRLRTGDIRQVPPYRVLVDVARLVAQGEEAIWHAYHTDPAIHALMKIAYLRGREAAANDNL